MSKAHTVIKKFNRKYHGQMTFAVTCICLIAFGYWQLDLIGKMKSLEFQMQKSNEIVMAMNDTVRAHYDSLTLEIDRVRLGISESAARSYKVNAGANIIMSARGTAVTETEALRISGMIYDAADRTGLQFPYLMAIIATESRFNPSVGNSSAGARGLCQLMPLTFEYVAKANGYSYDERDINDLYKNLKIGSIYLNDLVKRYGDLKVAAAGYNGGPGVAERYRRMAAGDTSATIPEETTKYMEKVMSTYVGYVNVIGK